MEEEEEAEEELVPGAHDKQNRLQDTNTHSDSLTHNTQRVCARLCVSAPHLGGVVDPEDGVPREVDALMTGGACYCRAERRSSELLLIGL